MSKPRHILGLSNSNCIIGPNYNLAYMEYILSLSEVFCPTVCYVGAAKGQNVERVLRFYRIAQQLDFIPLELDFFDLPDQNLATFFKNIDILYVDGGVTRNLLALFREWHVDEIIQSAYKSGLILSGASAGVNFLFEWCVTDSVKSDIHAYPGLGLLKGSICPHYDSEPKRRAVFETFLSSPNARFPAFGLMDDTGVHFVNETPTHIVSAENDKAVIEYLADGNLTHHDVDMPLMQKI